MKKIRLITSVILSLLLFNIPAVWAATDNDVIIINFAHISSSSSPKGKGALLFQKLVNERLNGAVRIEIHPKSTLFNDTDGLEALRRNEVQMMAPSLAKFTPYTKKLQLFDLPFLFDNLAAVDKFQGRPRGQKLLLSMVDKNITGLAYWHNGMKQMSATRPLKTPEDASGLAFRVQDSDVIKAQFSAVNARPVVISYSEMYNAIASGKVQGAENPWSNFTSQKLQNIQPYVTETNHGVLDYMLVTNSRFWYSIPHSIRYELESIITEVTYYVNLAASAETEANKELALESGLMQVVRLTPEQSKQWRSKMRPVWDKFAADIGESLIRSAEASN